MNEVNGGYRLMFSLYFASVSVCAHSKPVNHAVGELNAISSETIKATDFKFDTLVSRFSPGMTP